MAGDWIKIEHAMTDKPEVYQMAGILKIDPDSVVGKLIRLWVWCDQQTVDGNALGVTEIVIDRITHCKGFSDALRKVDWLQVRSGSLVIPRFDRHNGQTAKARALTNERVAKSRAGRNAGVTKNVTLSPLQKPLPEKRREEYLKPLTPFEKGDESLSLLGDPPPSDAPKVLKKEIASQAEKIYNAYPRKIGKPKALQAITRILKTNDFLTVLESTERYAKHRIGQDPTFTPHPATWFNQERFNDDPETWGSKSIPADKLKDDRPQVIDRSRPLPDFFQKFLDERPVYVERTEGRARRWKTENELPLSVRDDFDDWRGSYLRANKTTPRGSL